MFTNSIFFKSTITSFKVNVQSIKVLHGKRHCALTSRIMLQGAVEQIGGAQILFIPVPTTVLVAYYGAHFGSRLWNNLRRIPHDLLISVSSRPWCSCLQIPNLQYIVQVLQSFCKVFGFSCIINTYVFFLLKD